jgi:hypothetical protein
MVVMCGGKVELENIIGTITVDETTIQRYVVRFQQGTLISIFAMPEHEARRAGTESKTVGSKAGLCISNPLDPQRTKNARGE